MKKAITHIKLDRTNLSKIHKLDELAAEHQQVVQAYVDWLIAHEVRQPDKYAAIPETEVSTSLSDRWQRCAWQQACGIVQSWYSNVRESTGFAKCVHPGQHQCRRHRAFQHAAIRFLAADFHTRCRASGAHTDHPI